MRLPLAALALCLLGAAPPAPPAPPARAPMLVAHVVARYPHDRRAFTEGLIWFHGALYESIGKEGESEVRRVRLSDGQVMARARIPASQFGEGLARWGNQLVSLTWHDGIAHRWDARTLKPQGDARYPGEGWGLASDPTGFLETDGTATIKRFDPATMRVTGRIAVTLNGRPVDQLNEIEVVDGQILANVWHTPYLLRIDPASGRVTAVVNLSALVAEVKATDPEAVANGIAWDAKRRRLFVTGKLWPTLFEVTLRPA